MGITSVNMTILNPADQQQKVVRPFMVDSGATFSVMPAKDLKELGINPKRTVEIQLVDGSIIKRKLGNVLYRYHDIEAAGPIMFGEPGDLSLVGVVTLETLGLVLNPLKHTLKPMTIRL